VSPARFARCCLSLSRPIIDTIVSRLPPAAALALSIGSGSGLLERLIHTANPRLDFHGVEVNGAENVHLPEEKMHRVVGAWQVCPVAAEAVVWLFVYPRLPSLVRSYLDGVSEARNLQAVVWIGPVVDWEDFGPCFGLDGVFAALSAAIPLTDSEMMVLAVPRRFVSDPAIDQMIDLL
jgi:hypothetical protein